MNSVKNISLFTRYIWWTMRNRSASHIAFSKREHRLFMAMSVCICVWATVLIVPYCGFLFDQIIQSHLSAQTSEPPSMGHVVSLYATVAHQNVVFVMSVGLPFAFLSVLFCAVAMAQNTLPPRHDDHPS